MEITSLSRMTWMQIAMSCSMQLQECNYPLTPIHIRRMHQIDCCVSCLSTEAANDIPTTLVSDVLGSMPGILTVIYPREESSAEKKFKVRSKEEAEPNEQLGHSQHFTLFRYMLHMNTVYTHPCV